MIPLSSACSPFHHERAPGGLTAPPSWSSRKLMQRTQPSTRLRLSPNTRAKSGVTNAPQLSHDGMSNGFASAGLYPDFRSVDFGLFRRGSYRRGRRDRQQRSFPADRVGSSPTPASRTRGRGQAGNQTHVGGKRRLRLPSRRSPATRGCRWDGSQRPSTVCGRGVGHPVTRSPPARCRRRPRRPRGTAGRGR